jgi:hypothetical protein
MNLAKQLVRPNLKSREMEAKNDKICPGHNERHGGFN